MKRLGASVVAAVLLAGPLLARPAMADDKPVPVSVAFDGYSMTSGPLKYAEEKGLFRKFGLETKPTFVDGGSTLSHAVVGGSVDIAQNGYTPAVSAAVQGADIVIIGGISNKLPFQLLVRNAITNGQQLKGAKIAISRYGSSTDTAAGFALAQLGLKRDDVTLLQLGGEATRMAAAISGQIDGTLEQYPNTQELEQHGMHVLVDLTDLAGDYPNTAYVTTRAYLKAHRDVVKRFLMAMATAVHDFKSDPAAGVPLTAKFLNVKEPAAAAAFKVYTEKVYPADLRPSLKGIALVLEQLKRHIPAAASMKPEQVIDVSVLDELTREGFFKKLGAQG